MIHGGGIKRQRSQGRRQLKDAPTVWTEDTPKDLLNTLDTIGKAGLSVRSLGRYRGPAQQADGDDSRGLAEFEKASDRRQDNGEPEAGASARRSVWEKAEAHSPSDTRSDCPAGSWGSIR